MKENAYQHEDPKHLPPSPPPPPYGGDMAEQWPQYQSQTEQLAALTEMHKTSGRMSTLLNGFAPITLELANGSRVLALAKTDGSAVAASILEPLELAPASVIYPDAQPDEFILRKGVVAPSNLDSVDESYPVYDGTSLEDHPKLTATSTIQYVYLKIEVEPDPATGWTGGDPVPANGVGDFTIELHSTTPTGTKPEVISDSSVINGIYYRLIGDVRLVDGALVINQERFGPISATWCPHSIGLKVEGPRSLQNVALTITTQTAS